MVHRAAGATIPLYFGARPDLMPGEDLTSEAYLRAVERLPFVHKQGDGLRSFLGVILRALVGEEDILIIDEPEAFLHPHQARLLGQMLAEEKPPNRQLFLATHSGDFLRGVISANSTNVRIVRIRREGAINHVSELDQEGIGKLWNDPLLRSSNALDGLFHHRVFICEGDADCRFYSAVLNAIWAGREGDTVPDAMFTHCGGKHRIPILASALRALAVPVIAIADFDVFQEERPLRQILEALGGTWNELEADWREVKRAVDQKLPELRTSAVKAEIESILDRVHPDLFPGDAAEKIRAILRRSSPWSNAKIAGKHFVPAGSPTQALDRLMARLRSIGLHIVEVGELESFDRSINAHGPDWVNQVVRKNLANDSALRDAREFVSGLISSNAPEP